MPQGVPPIYRLAKFYIGCLQLGEARDSYRVVWYTTPDQDGHATPTVGVSVRWQT